MSWPHRKRRGGGGGGAPPPSDTPKIPPEDEDFVSIPTLNLPPPPAFSKSLKISPEVEDFTFIPPLNVLPPPPPFSKTLKISPDYEDFTFIPPLNLPPPSPPPSKSLKISPKIEDGAAIPTLNLRPLYITILKLMLEYRNEYGDFPSANSSDFFTFVARKGTIAITQERLIRALSFMEESFLETVEKRGEDASFLDFYLSERFKLSKQIWGRPDTGGIAAAVEDVIKMDAYFEDQVDQEQDNMDKAILKTILEFKIMNNGRTPESDSDDLYRFLVSLSLFNIQQDQFVDRISSLKERFDIIETEIIFGDDVDFPTTTRKEIYDLSKIIWADPNDDFLADHGENRGDEQDGLVDVEVRGDEQDGLVDVEVRGDEQDDQGKTMADEEDDRSDMGTMVGQEDDPDDAENSGDEEVDQAGPKDN